MIVLGLTGSIAMGKSNAAATLRRLGIPVYDADAEIHRLLGKGGRAVDLVGDAFPGVVRDGMVDRGALGARVFDDPDSLRRLERILHPLARRAQRRFLKAAARRGEPLAVLDIPLLFETGGDACCDATVVVSAPAFLQSIRALARPGMTEDRLAAVRAQQMSDREKRKRADFVVLTGLDRRRTLNQLRRIVRLVQARPGRCWPPGPIRRRHA